MKKKLVVIEITDEQLSKLKPLYNYVKKHPATGAIVGQARGDGTFAFAFFTPEEIKLVAKRMIEQRKALK